MYVLLHRAAQLVLLYCVVSDAQFAAWRVMYTYMRRQSLEAEPQARGGPRAGTSAQHGFGAAELPLGPDFDEHKHHQLMADLKQVRHAVPRG